VQLHGAGEERPLRQNATTIAREEDDRQIVSTACSARVFCPENLAYDFIGNDDVEPFSRGAERHDAARLGDVLLGLNETCCFRTDN
jgi:hypothetical protein